MKRIKIAIAIMAVVLIASLGIYFLADHLNSNKTKKETEEANKLILCHFTLFCFRFYKA